ncbi:MAG TPA: GTPase domain-containing protein [Candidatus Polarisedimenticolaceae bacterium]|nr:GTPase domain-containing protein [Candidatus Polarisedimenticolaceae bacterium]
MRTTVTLSLISHTNVGKTTLARTLLRRDVGEVIDREHVTERAESFTLIETERAVLRLWDTPGFGNSANLLRLLRRHRSPIGWLLHQTWDRVVNRPLYCSQQAAANVKQEADVVLYLVNAAEDPTDAGYVTLELELLGWIGRPVVLLLNQIGTDGHALETRWRELARQSSVVRDVLSLDAFTRCWVEEEILLRRVGRVLEGDKRPAMDELVRAWRERSLETFRASVARLASYLVEAAGERESEATGGGSSGLRSIAGALKFSAIDKRRAMRLLDERLDRATERLLDELIAAHGLEGASARRIERRVHDFEVRGDGIPIDERSGAVAGAVISGALTGLAADALSGGLTLGGGMIAGGILGALGGAALGRGYRWAGGSDAPSVGWSSEFLARLTRQAVLRYLAVAHFGRGRGRFRDVEYPAHWSEAVDGALAPLRKRLDAVWERARRPDADGARVELTGLLGSAIESVLAAAYPAAERDRA